MRRHVTGTFEGLDPPPASEAVAVGGTATSLRRLLGAELSHETLERGIRVLCTTPIAEVAARFELIPSGCGCCRRDPGARGDPDLLAFRCGLPAAAARGRPAGAGRGQAASLRSPSAPRPHQRHELAALDPRQAALPHAYCAPVSECTAAEKSGSWPTSSTSSPGRPPAPRRRTCRPPASARAAAPGLRAARRRSAPCRRRAPSGSSGRRPAHPDRLQSSPGRPGLRAPLVGQGTLRVRRAIGGVPMSQQPNHRDAAP